MEVIQVIKERRSINFFEPNVPVLIMIADPKGVEENMERVLDSWQALGFMKPEMRDFYTPGRFEGLLRSLSDLYNNEALCFTD